MSPELGVLRIASPCSARWWQMKGTDRVRFCGKCQRNVYYLSGMETEAARALLRAHEGRPICVRFYARRDGTVLTRDCPVGLRRSALVQRALAMGGVVAALALFLVAVLALFGDFIRYHFGMYAGGL